MNVVDDANGKIEDPDREDKPCRRASSTACVPLLATQESSQADGSIVIASKMGLCCVHKCVGSIPEFRWASFRLQRFERSTEVYLSLSSPSSATRRNRAPEQKRQGVVSERGCFARYQS